MGLQQATFHISLQFHYYLMYNIMDMYFLNTYYQKKKHKRKVLWNFMADVDITVVFYVKCK